MATEKVLKTRLKRHSNLTLNLKNQLNRYRKQNNSQREEIFNLKNEVVEYIDEIIQLENSILEKTKVIDTNFYHHILERVKTRYEYKLASQDCIAFDAYAVPWKGLGGVEHK